MDGEKGFLLCQWKLRIGDKALVSNDTHRSVKVEQRVMILVELFYLLREGVINSNPTNNNTDMQ